MEWDHISVPTELSDRLLSRCNGDMIAWFEAIGELEELIRRERGVDYQ